MGYIINNVRRGTKEHPEHERITKMKEFYLKIRELKMVVREFKKQTGIDAEIGAYGYHGDEDFKDVKLEMDDRYTGRRAGTVYLTAVMFDRRKSWVSYVEAE